MSSPTPDFLLILGDRAADWVRAYVTVTEELMRQGVPEIDARLEARFAASDAMYTSYEYGDDWGWFGEEEPWKGDGS